MRARGFPGTRVHACVACMCVHTRGHVCVYAWACTGRFVRGVAIHEFIRDRICTWQPELLVIKMCRSPFAPRARQEQEVFRSSSSPSQIMYAEEAIRARAALSPFPPKHVVSNVFNFSPRPEPLAPLSLYSWIFYSFDYCHHRVGDPASGFVASLSLNRKSSTVIWPFSVVPSLRRSFSSPLSRASPGHQRAIKQDRHSLLLSSILFF